jgi:DNA invertase Pin-like site-specific DNA recombinase
MGTCCWLRDWTGSPSTRDALNILDTISKAAAKLKSLADPWCDTTTPRGELMITVLGGLATFERHLIKVRPEGASGHRREGLGSAAS